MPLKGSVPERPKSDPTQFASLDGNDGDLKQPEQPAAAAVPAKPAARPAPPESPPARPHGAREDAATTQAHGKVAAKDERAKAADDTPDENVDVLFHALLANLGQVLRLCRKWLVSRFLAPVLWLLQKPFVVALQAMRWLLRPVRERLLSPLGQWLAPYFRASLKAYVALLLALVGSSVVVSWLTYQRTYGEVFKLEEKIAWLETERDNDALMIDKLTKANDKDFARIRQNEILLREKDEKIEALYQEQAAMNARLRELNARLPAASQSALSIAAAREQAAARQRADAAALAARQSVPCTISNSRDVKSAVMDCLQ